MKIQELKNKALNELARLQAHDDALISNKLELKVSDDIYAMIDHYYDLNDDATAEILSQDYDNLTKHGYDIYARDNDECWTTLLDDKDMTDEIVELLDSTMNNYEWRINNPEIVNY